MDNVKVLSKEMIGKNFITSEFLPADKDEYYLRNLQIPWQLDKWRNLREEEIAILLRNNNTAEDWNNVLVADPFDPQRIRNTNFFGLVRIGAFKNEALEHHELITPIGITNSNIISSDIGDDVSIHNVHYLAHYIINDRCILLNIGEMHTTNHAKFGNGIVKDGEPEDVRIWIDVVNESSTRRILPFDGIIPADAYIWAKYRDDKKFQEKLIEITQNTFDRKRGYYGIIGEQCVIKNCQIIKDVKIGSHCYIKGANKLKNLTINSTDDEPTQIGEGVELVNGIIGYGCRIFYGCKAVRFIMGNNSNLKYGARLIHSFLGDNSTVSCCELLNNLIFPAHEQHHNNSFLIASLVMGQSNIAAGATIGSNHNSRANDNEIQAGRGFWPGLCTSVKHSSRFASFVLLSKADYPAELNIRLPFSLVNNNIAKDVLEIMPAYWWLYNMYALVRNEWKFKNRDKRKTKAQKIEFEFLAPDTVEEIFDAIRLLEIWTAKAYLKKRKINVEKKKGDELIKIGRKLLNSSENNVSKLKVLGEDMERSDREIVILKVYRAYHAYKDMILYYGVKNLLEYFENNPGKNFDDMKNELSGPRVTEWVNLGGQIVKANDVEQLRKEIGDGRLSTWNEIHARYNELWKKYPLDKQRHAYASLCSLLETSNLDHKLWTSLLDKAMKIKEYMRDQVYISRKKDYDNKFRQITYRNAEEMLAALGTIEENGFIKQVRLETDEFRNKINELKLKN